MMQDDIPTVMNNIVAMDFVSRDHKRYLLTPDPIIKVS